jgi:hypothetical protein
MSASGSSFQERVRSLFADGMDTYDIGKTLDAREAQVLRVLRPYERVKTKDEKMVAARREAWRRAKAMNAKVRAENGRKNRLVPYAGHLA